MYIYEKKKCLQSVFYSTVVLDAPLAFSVCVTPSVVALSVLLLFCLLILYVSPLCPTVLLKRHWTSLTTVFLYPPSTLHTPFPHPRPLARDDIDSSSENSIRTSH